MEDGMTWLSWFKSNRWLNRTSHESVVHSNYFIVKSQDFLLDQIIWENNCLKNYYLSKINIWMKVKHQCNWIQMNVKSTRSTKVQHKLCFDPGVWSRGSAAPTPTPTSTPGSWLTLTSIPGLMALNPHLIKQLNDKIKRNLSRSTLPKWFQVAVFQSCAYVLGHIVICESRNRD